MDKDTIIKIAAGAAAGAGVAAGIASKILYDKTLPRPKETDQEIIEEFADPEKMAEYMVTMAPVGEWLEKQQLEDLYIQSQDGLRLHAFYLPAEEPSRRLAILHHGFTSKAKDNAVHAYFFHELGYEVLMLDMRAHGESEGKYTGFGILDRYDTLEWIKYSRERFGKDIQIVLHGVSMGAATVLMSLGLPGIQRTVSAVIADCAYTSPDDIFSHVIKKNYHLPPALILKVTSALAKKNAGYRYDDYSTLDALIDNNVPVLFIHGKEDKFVPTWMTQKNYEACSSEKELLFVDNAGHGSSIFENRELYEQTEREFLDRVFNKEAVNNEAEETVEEVVNKAEEAVEEVVNKAEEAVEEAANKAEEAVEEIVNKAEEVINAKEGEPDEGSES